MPAGDQRLSQVGDVRPSAVSTEWAAMPESVRPNGKVSRWQAALWPQRSS